ncbi:MAG: hypothetical protein IH880_06340 [Candidatus Marinimicrobia bacterium]|nr:hypothetical protein [Candidatus Neomarinimicrobiota bacterium]
MNEKACKKWHKRYIGYDMRWLIKYNKFRITTGFLVLLLLTLTPIAKAVISHECGKLCGESGHSMNVEKACCHIFKEDISIRSGQYCDYSANLTIEQQALKLHSSRSVSLKLGQSDLVVRSLTGLSPLYFSSLSVFYDQSRNQKAVPIFILDSVFLT